MKHDGSYHAVVLGWPTRANDEIECCLIHTTEAKATKPILLKHSLIRNCLMRKRGGSESSCDAYPDARVSNQHLTKEEPSLLPLVQIECGEARDCPDTSTMDKYNDDLIIHSDTSEIELVLPHLLFREDSHGLEQWQYKCLSYHLDFEDDPWTAAKKGDLQALKSFAGVDWTKTDAFESTPLYYACHSGAAKDIHVVKYLLDVWPGPVPDDIKGRCRKNAINEAVQQLLDRVDNESAFKATEERPDCLSATGSYFLEGWNIFQEEECPDY